MRTTEEKEAVIFLSLSLPPSDLVWESCLPLLSPTPKLDPAPLPSTLFCQSSAHGLGWEWNGVGTMIAQNEKGRQELERPVWGYTCLAPPPEVLGLWGARAPAEAPVPATATFPSLPAMLCPGAQEGLATRQPEWKCTSEKDPVGSPGKG